MKKFIFGIILFVAGFSGYLTISLVDFAHAFLPEQIALPLIISIILGLSGIIISTMEAFFKKESK